MKRDYILITASLLLCLFVYLFFRTERTVITQLFISLVSYEDFLEMREHVNSVITLPEFIIFSLPEGLWVFCISLTSRSLYIKTGSREIRLVLVPLVVAIGMELSQLVHLTRGRFDVMDIAVSILFWAFATYGLKSTLAKQNLFSPVTKRSLICIASYLIVYLAHVWK